MSFRDKIRSLDEAIAWRESLRAEGHTLAFTNGCFDLLHAGHILSIEFAAKQGDKLLIAVNTDAAVRANKGPERPIISEDDRAVMLAALEMVDAVVLFDTKEVLPVIEAIQPEVLVKGGDTTHVVGREFIESYGGRVVLAPELPNHSTTDIVGTIRQLS